MKHNFIKFKRDSVQLTKVYEYASGDCFNPDDILAGTLVIGAFRAGSFLSMGWLRGMSFDEKYGCIVYEIVNAVEGDDHITRIRDAKRVSSGSVPAFAATLDGHANPFIGRPFTCNGEYVKVCDGDSIYKVRTESIQRLEPLFKETK